MTRCAFCGRDPYEYVDVGVGMVPVAVTCCEFGCAVYDHRNAPETEVTLTVADLANIAGRVSNLEWQSERRNRLIEKLWKLRQPRT